MAKQLSHSPDRQKGMSRNFALLVVGIVKCLPIICSTGDRTWPFLGSLRPASGGEGEAEEKAEKAIEDLQREYFSRNF